MHTIAKEGATYNTVSTYCVDNLSTPLIMSIPHSGEIYPDDFCSRTTLPFEQYDLSADRYVHELMHNFTDLDIPTIKAEFPRVYVDVNRQHYDLDKTMLAEPEKWNYKASPVTKSTIMDTAIYGAPLYTAPIPNAEIRARMANCYVPYHQTLTSMIERTREKHGIVYLLDCHSMRQYDQSGDRKQRPEIDIGTYHGYACDADIAHCLQEAFANKGYQVTINKRFAGGEITQRYGWPENNQHALQIEFRRDLYMCEDTRAHNDNFKTLQSDCVNVLCQFHAYLNNRPS